MADSENSTTRSTTISELDDRRAAIIATALADNGRDLTDAEQEQVGLHDYLIVNTPAVTVADAVAQISIALEHLDLERDNVGTEDSLDIIYAALRSAQAAFAKAV